MEPTNNLVAGGRAETAETATVQLGNITAEGGYNSADYWTGSGEYYILLWESSNGGFSGNPLYLTSEKVNFSSETTTVEWAKFQAYTAP